MENFDIIEKDLGWQIQDITEKIKKGLKLLEEYIIECPNCRLHLIEIIKVKESSKINKIQVLCPKCNEESFIAKIEGEIYINSTEQVQLVDVDMQTEDECYKSIIKVEIV